MHQCNGEIFPNCCMYSGITKDGTQIPPIAAKIMIDIAPNPFDCSSG